MIFQLKIGSAENIESFQSNSALVKFLVDTKELENELNEFDSEMELSLNNLQRKNFMDKKGDEIKTYKSAGNPELIFILKVKIDEKFTADNFRNYLAGVIQSIEKEKLDYLHIIVPEFERFKKYFQDEQYYFQTFAEGIYLGNYSFDVYKSEKDETKKLNVNFYSKNISLLNQAIKTAELLIESVVFARDLVNEPAITLTPSELALRTRIELNKYGIDVKVFDQAELEKRKMNAILAVGAASENPPQLIVMHYKSKAKVKKKIALVGKGVTYDSGGLSIKSTEGMMEMKADMAGAAAVIGIMKAAPMAELPLELIGITPAVENMLSGKSYKPGDIIRTSSGKSIEVKDTDAEGRIVLSDALEYASKEKPDEIIDFATLTGACAVALGLFTAGLFTKNDSLAEALTDSGYKTFERVWRLPFWDDYDKLIESKIADVSNLGPRWGGAITAGKFLEHFVDKDIPWAHIDLAGPSIKHKLNNYTEKWDTGFGVRLIFDYLSKI